MKKCKQCQKEFEAKTAAAEFCSGACRAQTARSRAQMSGLPADVQASIEKMCAENNNGARAASHSRAAMMERALHYQRVAGKSQPSPTGKCLTCGGPVQHPKIVKCYQCVHGKPVPDLELAPEPAESGPLSVYSAYRWEYLQSKGHIWDADRQRSYRPDGICGVPVPGDPAYECVCAV